MKEASRSWFIKVRSGKEKNNKCAEGVKGERR